MLELERLTRELSAAGEDIEKASVYLSLEKKLPKEILRPIWTKREEDPENWTTTKFRKALSEVVRAECSI